MEGKFRRIPEPKNLQDLTKQDQVNRLNAELKTVVKAINDDRTISAIPTPTGFSGTFSRTGQAGLSWDDVIDLYRPDLDGARVWRADAATDPQTAFWRNNAKEPVVMCTRTTRYVDVEVDSGSVYVYWVQWINKEGLESSAAGGISGTIT